MSYLCQLLYFSILIALVHGQYYAPQPTITVIQQIPQAVVTSTITVVKGPKIGGREKYQKKKNEQGPIEWGFNEDIQFPTNLVQIDGRKKRHTSSKPPRPICPTLCLGHSTPDQFLNQVFGLLGNAGGEEQNENANQNYYNQEGLIQNNQQEIVANECQNANNECPVINEGENIDIGTANAVIGGEVGDVNAGAENVLVVDNNAAASDQAMGSTPTSTGGGSGAAVDYLYYDTGSVQIAPSNAPEYNLFDGTSSEQLSQFTSWTISSFTSFSNTTTTTKRARTSTSSDESVSMESSEFSNYILGMSGFVGSLLLLFFVNV